MWDGRENGKSVGWKGDKREGFCGEDVKIEGR